MRALLVAAAIAAVHAPTRASDTTAFPVIDAYGGRMVWSDYDASVRAWRLMESSAGVTRAVPVPARATPFDVDLGPDGHGGALAGRLGPRIAFVRGGRPYWRRRAGAGPAHRLPLPRVWRKGRSVVEGLDMRGRTVAYAWQAVGSFDTFSFVYRATTGGSLRALARGAYVAGGRVRPRRRDVVLDRRRPGRRVPAGGRVPLMAADAVAYGPVRHSYLQIPGCGAPASRSKGGQSPKPLQGGTVPP